MNNPWVDAWEKASATERQPICPAAQSELKMKLLRLGVLASTRRDGSECLTYTENIPGEFLKSKCDDMLLEFIKDKCVKCHIVITVDGNWDVVRRVRWLLRP